MQPSQEEKKQTYNLPGDRTLQEFYEYFGNDVMRGMDNDVRVRAWSNYIHTYFDRLIPEYKNEKYRWLITVDDVRFNNEAKAIKDHGGVLVAVDRKLPEDHLVEMQESARGIGFKYINTYVENIPESMIQTTAYHLLQSFSGQLSKLPPEE